ncbi:Hypothetical protein ABZS17I87_02741 [Kosakonia cowanii]
MHYPIYFLTSLSAKYDVEYLWIVESIKISSFRNHLKR